MKTQQTAEAPAARLARKYREVNVLCYGAAEAGSFAELEDGRRVYGLTGAAPDLLAALNRLQSMPNDPRAHRQALDAIAKAEGRVADATDPANLLPAIALALGGLGK